MILTIGHSTRPLDEFLALLNAHGVTQLADVRTVPKSRRHPHFAGAALAASLPAAGIAYRHFPGLGGLRKPGKDSINSAWRHEGFRGYADYMQTAAFEHALDELIAWAGEGELARREPKGAATTDLLAEGAKSASRTAIMCAESVWWRCHRQLVADALVARGIEVGHIMSNSPAPRHKLTDFARIGTSGRVTYPGLV